jgi:hypothetical protein
MPRRKIERSAEAFKAGTVFFFPSKGKSAPVQIRRATGGTIKECSASVS